jgi:hypothetical protein
MLHLLVIQRKNIALAAPFLNRGRNRSIADALSFRGRPGFAAFALD